ncbi:hypothetical protein RSOLAG1IB_04738 [Rhizoctonia solani AG-1 IB]|uniref:DDE-1 domain-containing protein n=1 Tax=Thanatephorus cucumeris (strain AG1-IB / isolate 7/3/14) TaxID=1108050 RepID=A0A0B7G0L8_THACB|nr:hypothetical protein RSOLAG1IB_04738 [Rhizoctonia solani AG-1 IB]
MAPGQRAKSLRRRHIEYADEKENLIQEAITQYTNQASEQTVGDHPRRRRKGLRTICEEVCNKYAQDTGRRIRIAHSVLEYRLKGGKSASEAHAKEAHLLKPENDLVCNYAIQLAKRGFPLSHKRLKEHIDELVRMRLPSFAGVGLRYTERFVDRNYNILSTYTSRALDGKRAAAVNQNTLSAWFKMLGEMMEEYGFDPDIIFNMDETGIHPDSGSGEKVIGPLGQKTIYQTRNGSPENITVIATICADGTSIPPVVIFKAKHYQVQWNQENPINASIGHSLKGWITGEIAVDWIKEFNSRTQAKAAGRHRLLIVDGHSSHMSRALLEYARENQIVMMCFPSHTTHVLQPLDKVCFSPFKKHWSDHRDEYERATGLTVQKANFIKVMSAAYVQAFTKSNIESGFRKTGIVPFNPSVIGSNDIAPAIEQSCYSVMPVRQPSPIQVLVDLMDVDDPLDPSLAEDIREALGATSGGLLVSDQPIDTRTSVPTARYIPLPPIDNKITRLSQLAPSTEAESSMQTALLAMIERDQARDRTERALLAQGALQAQYCAKVRNQLAGKEKRQERSGRLLGDGLPAVLTSDGFHARVVNQDNAAREEQARKEAIASAKQDHRNRLEEWKQADKDRIQENKEKTNEWRAAMDAWKIERDLSKIEKRVPGWEKPSKPKPQKASPKPKLELPSFSSDSDSNSDDE